MPLDSNLLTNIVKILFGIDNYFITSIKSFSGNILLDLTRSTKSLCPVCKANCPRYDSKLRKIYLGSISGIAIYASVKIYRLKCKLENRVLLSPLKKVDKFREKC